MKSILMISLIILTFTSCDNSKQEVEELNKFLKVNYEFNKNILNLQRSIYFTKIGDNPNRKLNGFSVVEKEYDKLIARIDNEILGKTDNIENLLNDYHSLIRKIEKLVKSNKKYTLDRKLTDFETISNNDEFRLNIMKNNLVIVFTEALNYSNGTGWISDSFNSLNNETIETKVLSNYNNSATIVLSSKFAQTNKENRHIKIKEITLNGLKKNIKYKISENYSFSDIKLDSLEKGTYEINGFTKYYFDRDENLEIPFKQKIEIK